MHVRIGIVLMVVVASSLLASHPASAAGPIPCRANAIRHLRGAAAMETIRVRNFHILVEPQADSYKIGSKAKLDITVTRPAHEDPAAQDIQYEPPASLPAENVTVGIGLHVGDVFQPGFGRTNAEGKTTVSIKLPRYMQPGAASLSAYAWNVIHESPCLRIEEDGYTAMPEAFEVTR